MEHYRKLERMYQDAPINQRDKPTLVVADGTAEIRQTVGQHLHHSAQAMHGSVYFKMLDDACFFAANSKEFNTFVLTVHFEIDLFKPVSDGEICAKAQVTEVGERRILAEGQLFDSQGQVIAKGQGVFAISQLSLTEDRGYK